MNCGRKHPPARIATSHVSRQTHVPTLANPLLPSSNGPSTPPVDAERQSEENAETSPTSARSPHAPPAGLVAKAPHRAGSLQLTSTVASLGIGRSPTRNAPPTHLGKRRRHRAGEEFSRASMPYRGSPSLAAQPLPGAAAIRSVGGPLRGDSADSGLRGSAAPGQSGIHAASRFHSAGVHARQGFSSFRAFILKPLAGMNPPE